ncbi:MAG: hypothetical protein O9294_16330 [Cytophagales bacterium]|nr:hypothetical protein [Cytophagales bacterium]
MKLDKTLIALKKLIDSIPEHKLNGILRELNREQVAPSLMDHLEYYNSINLNSVSSTKIDKWSIKISELEFYNNEINFLATLCTNTKVEFSKVIRFNKFEETIKIYSSVHPIRVGVKNEDLKQKIISNESQYLAF